MSDPTGLSEATVARTIETEAPAIRRCPRCDKRLARLNRGPWCYVCQQQPEIPTGTARTRRARLPHDTIIELYREVGDTTAVANRLGLARSSVWYVVERAKKDGRLPAPQVEASQGAA